jgi:small-conductance mechanosensitive channel
MTGEESQTPEAKAEYIGQTDTQSFMEQHENQNENSTGSSQQPSEEVTERQDEQAVAEALEQFDSLSEEKELQEVTQRIAELKETETGLKRQIADLQAQVNETQMAMGKVVQEALTELETKKNALQLSIEQLERRQERIRNEMRTTFAGASQDLAIRVQGFKDYLTGSLQDLASAAEQLQLIKPTRKEKAEPLEEPVRQPKYSEQPTGDIQFAPQQFQDTSKQIRRLIDQYRTKPDYYGPPWQLRRTFEPIHAERVSNWFFTQGGRGAIRTMGSRLQNILISSAAISILHQLYGERVKTIVLTSTPERLGEWRRGLQDCLGIGRPDFGRDGGVVIFETAEVVAQRADRLVKANQMPFIIIDDSEDQISLALLQFPLWLAFAPDPRMMRTNYDDDF